MICDICKKRIVNNYFECLFNGHSYAGQDTTTKFIHESCLNKHIK